MPTFNKLKIKANFNKAHHSYNANAILQKIVAQNLVALAKKDVGLAKKIIDLGSGTGFIAQDILSSAKKEIFQVDIAHKMLKNSIKSPGQIFNINADIEALPFNQPIFDLALSSLSFQWLNDLKKSLSEILLTIKKDGSFYFSLMGSQSLKELKQSCINCNIKLSINNFLDKEELANILSSLSLNYQIKSEIVILKYENLHSLLKSIKSIGAGYSDNKNHLNRNDFNKISNFYLKNFYLDNKVSATWEVFYITIYKQTKPPERPPVI